MAITARDFDLTSMSDVTLYGSNATFSRPVTLADLAENNLVQEIVSWLSSNLNVRTISQLVNLRLFGSHGVAKSSLPRAVLTALSPTIEKVTGKPLVVHVVPLASMSPDVTVFPAATTREDGRRVLSQRLLDAWTDPNVWHAFIWEEPSRAKAAARNAMLAVLTAGKLGGVEIPNMVGSIVTDNEGAAFGIAASPDFTFLDRFEHIEVTWKDAPWARYLADQFPTRDLAKLLAAYANPKLLTDEARSLYLTPRTLEHVVFNLNEGLPGDWGIPDRAGEHKVQILEKVYTTGSDGKKKDSGKTKDVTADVLDALAAGLGVSQPRQVFDKYRTAIRTSVRRSKNAYIQGPPGVGKTAAAVEAVLEEMPEANIFYCSLAEITPENWFLPLLDKTTNQIGLYLTEELLDADVLIFDEIWRAKGAVKHQLMEILQEGTFAGMPLKARTVIAMNNPKKLGELTLDTGIPDRAQADRFFINVRVDVHDIPSGEWLMKEYGKDGEDALDWWSNDVPENIKPLVTRRTLDRLISRNRRGRNLLPALVRYKGQYFGEAELHLLKKRFDGRQPATLARIAADLDCKVPHTADGTCVATDTQKGWLCKLAVGEIAAAPEHLTVGKALYDAELPLLEAHHDAVVRLLAVLGQQQRLNLVFRNTKESKADFIKAALKVAVASKVAVTGKVA